MKTYFSIITADHWVSKNKLQKQAHKIAREMERRIVPEDKVSEFKSEFWHKINFANKLFPRCHPLNLHIWKSQLDSVDLIFQIDGVFSLMLYQAKEDV